MIVVAGESLIDLLARPDGSLSAVPGGSPFNTARTLARLGARVAFLGRISTDRFGRMLRATLEADGVDCSLLMDAGDPTLLALAELDDEGHASYRFYALGTAAPGLTVQHVEAILPRQPAILHVGSLGLVLEPMAEAVACAIERVHGDTLVSLDPNCRPSITPDLDACRARLWRLLGRVDLVKASVEDLAIMVPGSPSDEAAARVLEAGPRVVVVTDGAREVRVHHRDGDLVQAVPRVTVVDTVGAGDAFAGGFLARWTERGLGRRDLADTAALRDAAAFAASVAALTCTRAGAQPPARPELAAVYPDPA